MKTHHYTILGLGLALLGLTNTSHAQSTGSSTQQPADVCLGTNQPAGTVWVLQQFDATHGIEQNVDWAAIWPQNSPSCAVSIRTTNLGSHLKPGDTLLLRGGYYRYRGSVENAGIFHGIVGTQSAPISCRNSGP